MQFLTGFLQFYWPDCSGNEDRKGLLTMHTFPPNRRLAQLDLWGYCTQKVISRV